MKKLSISTNLEEKIYDLKMDKNGMLSIITTFFPLSPKEKQEIFESIGKTSNPLIDFKSVFSDEISESQWCDSKEQIKKKFQDDLIEID